MIFKDWGNMAHKAPFDRHWLNSYYSGQYFEYSIVRKLPVHDTGFNVFFSMFCFFVCKKNENWDNLTLINCSYSAVGLIQLEYVCDINKNAEQYGIYIM